MMNWVWIAENYGPIGAILLVVVLFLTHLSQSRDAFLQHLNIERELSEKIYRGLEASIERLKDSMDEMNADANANIKSCESFRQEMRSKRV